MCGIYGQIGSAEVNVQHARLATERLVHRGPDEGGTWMGGKVFLGMRRLSIIDLTGGHQPIWNEDRSCCLIFNGELYNFLDLRPQLEDRGHVFRTSSDTEVVLHAYEEWDVDCLRHFNGMFAIAIWDAPRQRLFLARDRIGEKPLYYFRSGTKLAFASEIKALLADLDIAVALNRPGLANFLSFGQAGAPATFY